MIPGSVCMPMIHTITRGSARNGPRRHSMQQESEQILSRTATGRCIRQEQNDLALSGLNNLELELNRCHNSTAGIYIYMCVRLKNVYRTQRKHRWLLIVARERQRSGGHTNQTQINNLPIPPGLRSPHCPCVRLRSTSPPIRTPDRQNKNQNHPPIRDTHSAFAPPPRNQNARFKKPNQNPLHSRETPRTLPPLRLRQSKI